MSRLTFHPRDLIQPAKRAKVSHAHGASERPKS